MASLNGNLKKSLDRVSKIQDRDKKFSQQLEAARRDINKLKKEKDSLAKANAQLNRTVDIAPTKFQSMAEDNRRLIKESSDMHYNLGVLFNKNRDYEHAIKEFKRSLELNPVNAKAHYNLGYLYSEQLGRNDEAVYHFNKYLQINPNTKESEAIRSYLLTRQTYTAKAA